MDNYGNETSDETRKLEQDIESERERVREKERESDTGKTNRELPSNNNYTNYSGE